MYVLIYSIFSIGMNTSGCDMEILYGIYIHRHIHSGVRYIYYFILITGQWIIEYLKKIWPLFDNTFFNI